MSEFEIRLPEIKLDSKEVEARIKKTLTDDFEKGEGLLSKCLIFVKLYGPMAITDVSDKLQEYYKKEFERAYVYRACERLSKFGILNKLMIGDILLIPDEEKLPIHKHIEALHRKFLTTISPKFRGQYHIRNYVWFVNGEGNCFLEWACKLNKFSYNIK